MQKLLTPALLTLLKELGYTCLLSQTLQICGDDADLCITLLPVKYTPDLDAIPSPYDTYFEIDEEPLQMALGVDETIILVDLQHVIRAYPLQVYFNG